MRRKKSYLVPVPLVWVLLAGCVFLLGFLAGRKFFANPASVLDQSVYEEKSQVVGSVGHDGQAIATKSGDVITHGPRDKKRIAITFDAEMTDGMKAAYLSGKVKTSYDARIVDTLRQTHTKATFFLTGMWIELFPKETYDLSHDPLFELGSHSYTDSSFEGYCYGLDRLPDTLLVEEIGSTEKLLRKYAGIDNGLFRFPGGCYNQHAIDLVHQANDIVVHWDVSGNDGFNKNTNFIVNSVVRNVKNGSIIILHLNGEPTAPKTGDALPDIITSLKAKGFEFVKINELLGLPPEPRVPNNYHD